MGAFAGLLKAAGHRVTGSDTAFDPPMGEALLQWGIETLVGFDPSHLEPAPDLVVVGNVCRSDNPEARAAIDRGIAYQSFPRALRELFLAGRRTLVVAGTHGKTTTAALVSYLLDAAGLDPSFLVGGIPKNFSASFRLGKGGVFVVEGDEYDSAFFDKVPKFWSYRPHSAIVTSIEHDHVDIYPTMEAYRDAFRGFVSRLPPAGLLVANAADREVAAVCARAPCRVAYYALAGDRELFAPPEWMAAPIAPTGELQPFELYTGGARVGVAVSPLVGEHNVRNATAAIALLAEAMAVPVDGAVRKLAGFLGVKRRQELRGVADGVRVYDDFAHHPTAVEVTLRGMRARFPTGRLVAIFEPRSATAARNTHQAAYPGAFDAADLAVIAPVGRRGIAPDERLDVPALLAALRARGRAAQTVAEGPGSVDAIVETVAKYVRPGDVIVVLSNGAFGGIHDKLLAALAARSTTRDAR
jgi:UDP-N-acetylmuramate: L-alanyl-gamma-D-glutamyl-meso-diaminopimelate ligase